MRYKIKVVDHGDHKGASLHHGDHGDKKNSVQLCEIPSIPLWLNYYYSF